MATVRNLPLIQNWSCHACTDCCRIEAWVTDEEKRRIEALDLIDDSEIGPKPWFVPVGWGGKKWKLTHRPDGSCVFLTSANRCRLHERFGALAKPFVCRLFPFILIPAGNHWRVGMRFSCPSVAANQGRAVAESEKDLAQLALLLEQHLGRSADSAPPPEMQRGQRLAWPDVCRVVQELMEIVQDRSDRLEYRLRRCLAVARVCSQARLEGLSGNTLTEFLQAVRTGVEADVPRNPADVPPPEELLGRVLFRLLLAVYVRRDRGMSPGLAIRSRLGRVGAGWRFLRGGGQVPRINEFLQETTFEAVEQNIGLPPELDETLERYYVAKLNALQFCGPPNFNLPFWAGLESLILTLPMILWLRRALIGVPPLQALQQAIQIVDDHFGRDPMLDLPHFRFMQRTLAERGQLERLVAWYGR